MKRSKAVLFIFGAAMLPAVAQANVIANGMFGSFCGSGSFCTYNVGDSTDIPGWTVTNGGSPTDANGSVDLITGYWQSPPGGGNSVDLDGLTFGGVSQTFATVAGRQYSVSFYLSGNPDGQPVTKVLGVSAALNSQPFLYTLTGSNTEGSMGWLHETFSFLATSAVTTLSFTSLDSFSNSPGYYGPVVGNVDVEATPEPSSLALLGLGILSLFGLGLMRRRAVG